MTRAASLFKTFLWNVFLLVVLILPLFVLMVGAFNWRQVGDFFGEAVLLYVGMLGPTVIGGLLYLVVTFVLVRQWPNRGRIIALGLTPFIAVGWIFFGMSDFFSRSGFLVSFIASVLLYGALVRLAPAGS